MNEPTPAHGFTIHLGKGTDALSNQRCVQFSSEEMGVEVVISGLVEHVSTLVFLVLDQWAMEYSEALVEDLINQMAACDFFDANQIMKELMNHEHQRNGRADGTILGSGE